MSLYLDTSALIKLLIDELGCDIARDAYRRATAVATSAVTRVEAVSALTRIRKGRRISATQLQVGLRDLEQLWAEIEAFSVTPTILRHAEHAATDHGLRAYDSLHIATAQSFAAVGHIAFACWDRELRDAAQGHGFVLVPAQI